MKKIVLVLALVLAVGIAWYEFSLRPVDASDDVRRPVTIQSGLSVSDIGALLELKSVIRSARAFSLYVRINGSQASLQAGDFLLQSSMSVPEVIEVLRTGKSEEVSITIPEGYTVDNIDDLLATRGLLNKREFVPCATDYIGKICDFYSKYEFLPKGGYPKSLPPGGLVEGYLFPDTYLVFRENFQSQKFIERLLDNFRKRVIAGLASDLAASRYSLHEIITMASLIEEETKTGEERPIVAGILWKRLEAKQGLGVDAALRYILNKPTSAITTDDLEIDSPYNLRKYRGLPPGPIANPGLSSIKAALHPEDSQYWYYLHGKDGVIHYAETNDEHNKNKALYLR